MRLCRMTLDVLRLLERLLLNARSECAISECLLLRSGLLRVIEV